VAFVVVFVSMRIVVHLVHDGFVNVVFGVATSSSKLWVVFLIFALIGRKK
jgi:hypothetical protein